MAWSPQRACAAEWSAGQQNAQRLAWPLWYQCDTIIGDGLPASAGCASRQWAYGAQGPQTGSSIAPAARRGMPDRSGPDGPAKPMRCSGPAHALKQIMSTGWGSPTRCVSRNSTVKGLKRVMAPSVAATADQCSNAEHSRACPANSAQRAADPLPPLQPQGKAGPCRPRGPGHRRGSGAEGPPGRR